MLRGKFKRKVFLDQPVHLLWLHFSQSIVGNTNINLHKNIEELLPSHKSILARVFISCWCYEWQIGAKMPICGVYVRNLLILVKSVLAALKSISSSDVCWHRSSGWIQWLSDSNWKSFPVPFNCLFYKRKCVETAKCHDWHTLAV